MIVVKFKDVGRRKKSWTAACSESEMGYDWLYGQIRRRAGVMSQDIDFIENIDDEYISIYAGARDNVHTRRSRILQGRVRRFRNERS